MVELAQIQTSVQEQMQVPWTSMWKGKEILFWLVWPSGPLHLGRNLEERHVESRNTRELGKSEVPL